MIDERAVIQERAKHAPLLSEVWRVAMGERQKTIDLLEKEISSQAEGEVNPWVVENIVDAYLLLESETAGPKFTDRALLIYGDVLGHLAGEEIKRKMALPDDPSVFFGRSTGRFFIHKYKDLLRPALVADSPGEIEASEVRLKAWLGEARENNPDQEDIIPLIRAIRESEGFNPDEFSGENPLREAGRFSRLAVQVLNSKDDLVPKRFRGQDVNKDYYLNALVIFSGESAKMEPVLRIADQRKKAHPAAFGLGSEEIGYLMHRDYFDQNIPVPPKLVEKLTVLQK
ncbi:hypothetical protein ISS86_02040 [Candidatus Microgenomates bacterium]|nr:hypothetical protein [Candidatus Microgenomates bacterium]